MRIILFSILIFIVAISSGFAQGLRHQEQCGTMEIDSINRAKYPGRGRLEDFEDFIQQRISEIKKQKKGGRIMAELRFIPIIVHVVHNGEAVGTGANISQAQVQSQIEVLNEDFRKMFGTPGGASTNPVAADIELEFCLSPTDEAGNPMAEPGIERVNGGRSDWTHDQIELDLKSRTQWEPSRYYNIWTVKFAAVNASLIGYAQFPDQSGLSGLPASGPASTDGVVIRYQSFGSTDKGTFPVMIAPYNKGRTLTHETGHWLGLRHIWGDGGCEATDFVDDTPPAAGSSSGCNVARVSCNNTNMVQNYMDYSDDACMNIFTEGQKLRMRVVMDNSPRRKTLTIENLCEPPVAAAPVTNFIVENPNCVLVGSNIQFTDLSTNRPTEWHWTFEGGDPATQEVRTPTVTYTVPGIYSVTLWTKNKIGISDTLTKEGLITVTEEGICSDFNNFDVGNTPSLIKMSAFGSHGGYLTGTNSLKSKAVSEYFKNQCGYVYISGLNIRFGKAYTLKEDAKVNFVVWNARGPQSAPGSVIERKVVLFKQIQEDIANHQPTSIIFDRETPIFGKPFQVGIELENNGDSLAIISSANGEGVNATSWIKDKNDEWQPMAIAFGANIAMDIQPIIGMNPSVQVAASNQVVYPGQTVTMNGRGASIFVWNSNDGVVNNFTGPQLIVNPEETTSYTITGSGLELCNSEAVAKIYVNNTITQAKDNKDISVQLYPNPGGKTIYISMNNNYVGAVEFQINSMSGQSISTSFKWKKTESAFDEIVNVPTLVPGIYMIRIKTGKTYAIKKWVSIE